MAHSLEDIAATYRRAAEAGLPPTVAVQAMLNVSRATAGRYIRNARREGVLIAPIPQRPHPRLAAVAAAVGVSEAALREAIWNLADGDLRLSSR